MIPHPPLKEPSSSQLTSFLRQIPKVDLHCHLDGSLRVKTILDLARETQVKLPANNIKDLTSFVQVSPTCQSLSEFLQVFYVLYPLLRTPQAIERVAYELCEDCAKDNIRYVEVRFAPMLNAHDKFSIEDVLNSALKGLARGEKKWGVQADVVVCLFRSHSTKENRKAFEAAKHFWASTPTSGPRVVGIDLAGDEARHPTLEFSEFFEEARSLGIPTTCHAGETKGTENLKAALELRVQRIGHGIHLMEDQKLLKQVVERRIPLEIGITSNVRTKTVSHLQAHPVRAFHDAGVRVSLNTDDRGILGIDLTHEYGMAVSLGFQPKELIQIGLESIEHLFITPEEKMGLKEKFQSEIVRLNKRLQN
ncbi:MAG: adenosine deaminase [Elusimicrobia bacterium]|nr:adenosine deaminase [Elusimicrobiota bacterium]